MKNRARRIRYAVLVAIAATLPALAHAQSGPKPGDEWFIVRLGAVSGSFETSARIDGSTAGGTNIDLESDGGLSSDKSTFILGLTLRPWSHHRFDGLYDEVKRSASRSTERQYVIGDTVIPAGTTLSAEQETKIGYVGYRYSFLKNPDMEIAGGIGMYGGNFKFKFGANSPSIGIDKSTTLPLPVFVLSGDFYLTENMTVSGTVRGLKVKIGDVDGSVFNASLAGEYFFTRNLGVGAAADLFDLSADVTKPSFRGNIEFKATSGRVYLTARF